MHINSYYSYYINISVVSICSVSCLVVFGGTFFFSIIISPSSVVRAQIDLHYDWIWLILNHVVCVMDFFSRIFVRFVSQILFSVGTFGVGLKSDFDTYDVLMFASIQNNFAEALISVHGCHVYLWWTNSSIKSWFNFLLQTMTYFIAFFGSNDSVCVCVSLCDISISSIRLSIWSIIIPVC